MSSALNMHDWWGCSGDQTLGNKSETIKFLAQGDECYCHGRIQDLVLLVSNLI